MEEIRKEALALKTTKPPVEKGPSELIPGVPLEERALWGREVLERRRRANIVIVGVGGY